MTRQLDYPKNILILIFGQEYWDNQLYMYDKSILDEAFRYLIRFKIENTKHAEMFIQYHSTFISLTDIAKQYGVTKQSISQILIRIQNKLSKQSSNLTLIFNAYLSQHAHFDQLPSKAQLFDMYLLGFSDGYEKAKRELAADQYKNVSIDSIGISMRAVNLLKKHQIATVQQLMVNIDNLKQVSNIGKTLELEIVSKLNEYLLRVNKYESKN